MKMKFYWITALVIFFLVIVLRNIPAQWGLALANVPLQFSGVTGTVWRGQAASVVLPLDGGAYALGEVQWTLSPLSLLAANPCAEIKTNLDNQQVSGTACVGLGGSLQLENTQIAVPAKVAEIFAPIVEVDGEILMHVQSLDFDNNQFKEISGSGSWSRARFYNSTSWVGLGTLGFEFAEDGTGGIKAKIFDVEGPMQVQLDSQFNLAGNYLTEGEVQLRPSAPKEIADLFYNYTQVSHDVQEVLALFVQAKGQNAYSIRWTNPE